MRLQLLREWSHEVKDNYPIFLGSPGTRSSLGAGLLGSTSLVLGDHLIDSAEDRLFISDDLSPMRLYISFWPL